MKSLESYRNKYGQIWLNVASSSYILEDFINIDNHIFIRILDLYPTLRFLLPKKYHKTIEEYHDARSKAVLARYDCRASLPFLDDSIDHILCSHFLEHVYPDEMMKIIHDFYRVLRKGRTAHIIVPDLALQVDRYIRERNNGNWCAADDLIKATLLSGETRGTLKRRLLEFLGGFGLQHRWMYDKASMSEKLRETGFEVLDRNDSPSHDYRMRDGQSCHIIVRKP